MSPATKSLFIIGITGIITFTLLVGLGNALMPLIVAFGLAYLSFPAIQVLEKRGISRVRAVSAVLGFITTALVLTLILVIPNLISEARQFLHELPQNSVATIEKIENFSGRLGYPLDISKQGLKDFVLEHSSAVSGEFLQSASNFLKEIFSNFLSGILAILNLFLIPLFFFHLVNKYETISEEAKDLVPIPWRPKFSQYTQLTNTVLSGYVRGQILVALILAILYGFGFWVIDLRFGLLIGIATGLFSIIPFVGSILGFIAAMTVALANFTGVGTIIAIAIVFFIIQMLEGLIITPKLVGNKVGLGALSTMLALIIGGNLFGFAGMLVAIPVAAILKSILHDLRLEYKNLSLYKGS